MAFLKYVSIDVGPGRVAKIKKNYTYVLIFLIKLFQIGQKVFIFAGDFLAQKMLAQREVLKMREIESFFFEIFRRGI